MERTAASLLLCLGLFGLIMLGGATAAPQDATGGEIHAGYSAVSTADADETRADAALGDSNGTTEVIVLLPERDRAVSTTDLQRHASETRQPLLRFAGARSGVTVENTFWLTNAALVTVDTSRVSLSDLAAVDGVRALRENVEFQASAGAASGGPAVQSPGTDASSYTYGLEQINAPTAWANHNTTGEGASVAVLDTGVDTSHPDLNVTKWQEFDGDGDPIDSQPNDGDGHGTHVSGTVSGPMSPDGDVPAYGVAPGVDLYGVKVLDDSGVGTFAQIIAGMEWAVNENVDIISMSLGAPGFYDQMIDPVRNAQDAGTVVIASSGNSGEGSSGSPGNVYDSVAVGMSNESRGIDSDSSGEVVDTESAWSSPPTDWPDKYTVPTIAAPGVDVLSSVPGGGYGLLTGTSMAAPHVSGAVALAESATDGSLAPGAIEEALEETAVKPDSAPAPPGERDTRYGSGVIDAEALVNYLQAEFAVSVLSANAPVVGGEQLNVTAEVNNTGTTEATQKIDLGVGDLGSSSTSVTLGGGNSTNVTLSVGTGAGDAGEYTATVSSPDDAASTNVTVLAPAAFAVGIVETNTPVEGEQLNVTASINNTGDVGDTQTVTLDVSVLGTDSTSVTLGGGNSTNLTLSVGTSAGDAGSYTAAVSSDDDTDNTTATVATGVVDRVELSPASNQTLKAGETIEFNATAFNSQGTVLEDNDTAFGWDAEGGSLSGAGLFTETGFGVYNVTAAFGNVTSGETMVVVERGLATYANESGIINTSGLLAAVGDWRDDTVNTFLMFDVVDAWRSGAPVTDARRLRTGHAAPREGEANGGVSAVLSPRSHVLAVGNGHPSEAPAGRWYD